MKEDRLKQSSRIRVEGHGLLGAYSTILLGLEVGGLEPPSTGLGDRTLHLDTPASFHASMIPPQGAAWLAS